MKGSTGQPLHPQCSGSLLVSWPDTIVRCTADGVVTAYHRGLAGAGIGDQDVVGRSLSVLLPAPAAQVLLSTVKQTLARAAPQSAGYALVPFDGQSAERRYFEVRTVPAEGSHVLCVIRDITEQRIAEQGLIRRDLYLGALTQVHHRLLAALPQDGPITSDTLAMLGYAAGADLAYYADLRGASLDGDLPVGGLVWRTDQRISQVAPIALDKHLRRRPFAHWLQALKSGRPVQTCLTDAIIDTANGTTFPVTCLVLPIIAQGQLVGLLGLESCVKSEPWPDDEVDYLRAATAAIAVHIERANVIAQLEENAEEIVRMNVQLADARDLARASDRAKSEFLAVVGHEIRTPLNPVISMTEMLLGTRLTSEQRDYAELAHEAANLLLVQINAILDYIDVESGNLKLEKLPFDPVDIVETVADLFKPQARERHLTLMTFCHPDLPPQLLGDPARLGAVLENLLDNALKFTEEGEIILRVEPVSSEPSTDKGAVRLRFSVSDTGIGLPEGAEEWLFQPFTQADSTTTRRFGGAGLGLATTRCWVGAMGGQMGVRANPVGGTVFWYSVRCDVAPGTVKRWGPDEPWQKQTLDDLRVLVVDDLAGNRDILKSYLELWNAACDVVADGPQALAALRRACGVHRPYHVALIDLMLPGMDGIALAGEIQQHAGLQDTRLVLITAYDAPGQEQRVRRVGFSGYLTKPFHRARIFSALVHAMATVDGTAAGRHVSAAVSPLGAAGAGVEEVATRDLPTVLLIEHNTILRRVAAKDVANSGCELIPVATEAEALRVLSDRAVDLVLFDLQGDRAKLAESVTALRSANVAAGDGRRRSAVVLGMTAQPGPSTQSRCAEAGLDGYITKPLTPTAMRQLLSRWCDSRL